MTAGAPRFRRALRTIGRAGAVDAEVLDDFHHFGLTLEHDGARATSVRGWARRYPWTTCLDAPGALSAFEGLLLDPHPLFAFRELDPRLQCTHLFELCALALAQAARGEGERRYSVEVADPVAGFRHATLWRDGEARLAVEVEVEVEVDVFRAPPAFAGTRIRDLTGRALAAMPPEEGEAWMILRRALQTSRGRQMKLGDDTTLDSLDVAPLCFTGLPNNRARAGRVAGSQIDFSEDPVFEHRMVGQADARFRLAPHPR